METTRLLHKDRLEFLRDVPESYQSCLSLRAKRSVWRSILSLVWLLSGDYKILATRGLAFRESPTSPTRWGSQAVPSERHDRTKSNVARRPDRRKPLVSMPQPTSRIGFGVSGCCVANLVRKRDFVTCRWKWAQSYARSRSPSLGT